jgi:hypothetical protein
VDFDFLVSFGNHSICMREPTKAQLGAGNLYASFLLEAKIRIKSIDLALQGKLNIEIFLVREYCYLQLRMLCELIALGCLTMHGDIKDTHTNDFQKSYDPTKIIKKLESLHANFYPHPVNLTITPGNVHIDRIDPGFLTKKELSVLWNSCGSVVHRGTMKEVMNVLKNQPTYDIGDIFMWRNKIVSLLDRHHIASLDNLTHFICVLQSQDHGGNSMVSIALSPLPQ